MARGGKRPGAGRKPKPATGEPEMSAGYYRERAARLRAESRALVPAEPKPMRIPASLIEAIKEMGQQRGRDPQFNPFDPKSFHPPSVIPPKELRANEQMAMDSAIGWASNDWAMGAGSFLQSVGAQGLLFPGYPFLSELAQRPEYDAFSDIIATEMTRKWIKFRGRNAKDGKPDEKADKIQELESFMDDLDVRGAYKTFAKYDGLMGRAHLFHEIAGNDGADENNQGRSELSTSLYKGGKIDPHKVNKDQPLTRLTNVEAVWVYPTTYNANNPLAKNFYRPDIWYTIGGREMHFSRMPCLIGRPVPDLLKPAYSFGGLALSQIAMPYVDIWLNTRESIGRLVKAFSTPVLMSDLQTLVQPNGAELLQRVQLFNAVRDNMSCFLVNKATEDFKIEAVPLSGLSELQAQSQEHLCVQKGTLVETGRGQVPIENITTFDTVLTRKGFSRVKWAGVTGRASHFIELRVGSAVLRVTPCHPIWCQSTNEFVPARNVSPFHRLLALETQSRESTANRLRGVGAGGGSLQKAIIATKRLGDSSTMFFGELIAALSRKAVTFITETKTISTIPWTIWSYSPGLNISPSIFTSDSMYSSAFTSSRARNADGILRQLSRSRRVSVQARASNVLQNLAGDGNQKHIFANAWGAMKLSLQNVLTRWFAPINVVSVSADHVGNHYAALQPVYNLEVDGPSEFFANGVLVHNCSVSRIPVAVYTGISPTGLNASSEGEIRIFENTIHAYQEARFRNPLNRTVEMCMLSLWGAVDEDIVYQFVPLREMTEKETAEINKMKAETDDLLVNGVNAIAPEEVRVRIAGDPDSGYDNIDPDDTPEPPEMVDPTTGQPLAGGGGAGAGSAPAKPSGKINLTGHEEFAGNAKPPKKAANDRR